MKIALINASPKTKGSTSEILLNSLKVALNGAEFSELKLRKPEISADALDALDGCDVWVFAYPLYVDGLPSHLLSCLMQLEKAQLSSREKRVYALANCGLYEGAQNRFSHEIIENWCKKAGFSWCGGAGIGAGPCLSAVAGKRGSGPAGVIDKKLDTMGADILAGKKIGVCYASPAIPPSVFKYAGQLSWRMMIKGNGGKIKDLKNRPEE